MKGKFALISWRSHKPRGFVLQKGKKEKALQKQLFLVDDSPDWTRTIQAGSLLDNQG